MATVVDALYNLWPKLADKDRRFLKPLLKNIPSLLLGNIEVNEHAVKIIVPVGESLKLFVRMKIYKSWLDQYTKKLAWLADLFLDKKFKGWVKPQLSLKPGELVFEYVQLSKEELKQKVHETILSYVIPKQAFGKLPKERQKYDEIKAYLIKKKIVDKDLVPLKGLGKGLSKSLGKIISNILRTRYGRKVKKSCLYCRKSFNTSFPKQVYCSNSCRVMASRKRKKSPHKQFETLISYNHKA